MKSWIPRDSLHAPLLGRVAALAATAPDGPSNPTPAGGAFAAAAAAAPPEALPQPVLDWLTQLTMLYGVPFEYLVADSRLLPPESLRFFYVDRNWQDRLVDGALSIGANSTSDTLLVHEVQQPAYAQIDAAQAGLRAALRGRAPIAGAAPGGTWTGFLFRSVVVSTWPGLEVNATAGGVAVPIVRMDLLTSDILLCILDGVPDTVQLIEPGEGLHFGVLGKEGDATFAVSLRGLGYPASDPYAAGAQVAVPRGSGNFVSATGSFRSGTGQPAGVLDVSGLVASIEAGMPSGALGPTDALGPGGFAIQMVRGAGLQGFETSQPPPPVPATPTAAHD